MEAHFVLYLVKANKYRDIDTFADIYTMSRELQQFNCPTKLSLIQLSRRLNTFVDRLIICFFRLV